MIRKTLTILSLIGLLLSVGLWGASYWYVYCFYAPARHSLVLANGHMELIHHVTSPAFDAQRVSRDVADLMERKEFDTVSLGGAVIGWMGFEYWKTTWWSFTFEKTPTNSTVGFPLWVPCLVFAVLPSYSLTLLHRRRKRKRRGLCVKCGYSLKALTKPRCPECDTPFSEKLLAAFRPIKSGVNHRGVRGQYARITAALFPELRRFETEFDRWAAWKSANRKVLRQPLYWLCVLALVTIGMLEVFFFPPTFLSVIVAVVIGLVSIPAIFILVARRTIQQTLRERLIEGGVPICLKCGYNLRESKERCPECGTPFDDKLLKKNT